MPVPFVQLMFGVLLHPKLCTYELQFVWLFLYVKRVNCLA